MAFNDFVQIELPKRPFSEVDGAPGQVPIRSLDPLRPRELIWVDAASLGVVAGLPATHHATLQAGVTDYALPYPAVAALYQVFLNGLLTTATIANGNEVRLTEFPANQIEDGETLDVFYII